MERKTFMSALTSLVNQKMPALLFAATLIVVTLGAAPYAISPVAAQNLTLSVSSGNTGTFVTVYGSGFWANTQGLVHFDQDFNYLVDTSAAAPKCGYLDEGGRCEPWQQVTSDSAGNFTVNLIIPPGKKVNFLGAGTYVIAANLPTGGNPEGLAPFQVPAAFGLSPNTGDVLTTVSVSGNNFAPYLLNGNQSWGHVWVDTNNNFVRDPDESQILRSTRERGDLQVPGSERTDVQVYVLPDGSLSACPSSSCAIRVIIPPNVRVVETTAGGVGQVAIRVNIVHEADLNRSVAQKIEASATFKVRRKLEPVKPKVDPLKRRTKP